MRAFQAGLGVAVAGLALALAGCGGGGDGDAKVPSAEGGASSAAAAGKGEPGGGDEVSAYVESQRKWVACMRKNGIDLPDPNSRGQVDISGQGTEIKKAPQFTAASEKCAGLKATVPQGLEEANEPKLTPAQIKVQQDYADCMQKNGALDFPDPDANGYETDDNSGQPVWDQDSAGAKRAMRVCAPVLGHPADSGPAKG
ncbi:hypothetical protein [Streptomyces sp. NRRL F-5123]|uniref:hypothetical protein n=1 Tax=Streptomyces sp. NRRL F-5123 TaxID=1463856 RepID=UPI0004E2176F|nr:hypothetical protein [Streptomyces sp. NRRL F-5123]